MWIETYKLILNIIKENNLEFHSIIYYSFKLMPQILKVRVKFYYKARLESLFWVLIVFFLIRKMYILFKINFSKSIIGVFIIENK
jgi:hypothetical protein